jgi:GNAT superfamily N-acetyltransferase
VKERESPKTPDVGAATRLSLRPLAPDDDLFELTELLHRAYAQLATMGLHFVATHQDAEVTRARIQGAECYVAEMEGQIVGTIVFRDCLRTGSCEWYDRPDVASFGQFGVEPDMQGHGIGSALLDHVEKRALEVGASEIALDTAAPATHLIELYSRRGYRIVENVKWEEVNYSSVIMSKRLL